MGLSTTARACTSASSTGRGRNEQGFATTIRGVDPEGWERSASLRCLYVACGLGPPQAVPEGAGTAHTITKRLAQHASALRQVMPH